MIEFHAGAGPDTQAVGIALEEMFFDYRVMPGRAPLPVIAIGGARVVGASNIVMALARKARRFLVTPEEAAPWLVTPLDQEKLAGQLAGREFILGGFSVADMMAYPQIVRAGDASAHNAGIAAWLMRMAKRPAAGRGMGVVVR